MNRRDIIVIGGTHHNSLGVIRSLGERGYEIEFISVSPVGNDYVSKSKYVTKYQKLNGIDEICDYLKVRDVADNPTVIISCADAVTEHLNLHLSELEEHYFISGVPEQGKMVELMDKTTMIEMAAKRGINAPTVWGLPADRNKVTFPCITNVTSVATVLNQIL